MSESTRLKMRLAKLGKPRSGNPINWKQSKESKEKNRIAHLGKTAWNKGKKGTGGFVTHPEIIFKGTPNKGKKASPEKIKKMSDSHKGKKHSEETKRKMSQSNRGERHWAWITDRSKLVVQENGKSAACNYFRKQVRLRDNNKCKINNSDCLGQLEVHHILDFKNHPELRYDINNGITLCHFHHPRGRIKEKLLSPYFQNLISIT